MKPFSYFLIVATGMVLAGCVSQNAQRVQEREYIKAANAQFARADNGGNDKLVGISKEMVEHAKAIFPDDDAVIEAAKKAGKKITFPRLISAPQPTYPMMAQIAHAEGYIWVAFIVNESGNVEQANALQDPDSAIAEAAVNAVMKWKFAPGRIDGSPARIILTVPVSFEIMQ